MNPSLQYTVAPFDRRRDEAFPALVLLHGRGANEEDLLALHPYLDPRLLVVAVRAPFPFAYGGWTWYDLQEIGYPDHSKFSDSYERLVRFIADFKAQYPVDPKRLFLLGFSMGAVMAYAYALTRPEEVRGVIAHSGYVPENELQDFKRSGLNGTSYFVAHGTEDPVIPVSFARRARLLLEGTGAELSYKEYPIPHTMSEESIGDFSAWLTGCLNKGRQ